MSAVQNMLGPGNSGNARLLPAVKEVGSSLAAISNTLTTIDNKMASIVNKAMQMQNIFRTGGMNANGTYGAGTVPQIGSGTSQPSMDPNRARGGTVGGAPAGGGGGGGGVSSGLVNTDLMAHAVRKFAGHAASQMPQAYQDNLLYNRTSMLYNGGSYAGQQNAPYMFHDNMTLQGQGGYVNTADRNSALNAMRSAGIMNYGSAGFDQNLAGMALMSGSSASAIAGIQTGMAGVSPNMQLMARGRGINLFNPATGAASSTNTVLNQLLNAASGGRGFQSQADLTASLGVNGPLRQALTSLGWSDEDISNVATPYYSAYLKNGNKPVDPTSKAGRNLTGIQNSNINHYAKLAGTRDDTNAKQASGLANGLNAANDAAEALAEVFNDLGSTIQSAIGYGKGLSGGMMTAGPQGGDSPFSSAMGLANHAIDASLLKNLLLGRGGGGLLGKVLGKVPGLGGIFGGGEGAAGAGGLGGILEGLGGAGALAGAGGLGLAGFVGGNLTSSLMKKFKATRGWSGVGGDTVKGAGIGAGLGLLGGPFAELTVPAGAVIGGGVGAGIGLTKKFGHSIMKHLHLGGLGFGAASGDGATAKQGAPGAGGTNMSSLIGFAEKQIGTPYSWGGGGVGGPSKGIDQGSGTIGFDCSSFVQYVFAHFGVQLPRTTYEQVKCGTPVDADHAVAGDLLFSEGPASSPGHVGIYLGNGNVIEAPHTGASVRIRAQDPHTACAIRRVASGLGGASIAAVGSKGASDPLSATNNALAQVSASLGIATTSIGPGASASGSSGSSGGGAPNAGAGAAPNNLSANMKLGQQMAAARGWKGSEWNALYQLWQKESGWNANSVNPSSGAYGIPQALGHGHPFNLGDARGQIAWGLDYISGRYKDPQGAWDHEVKMGWYDTGAWRIRKDEMAVVHKDEMVLDKDTAGKVRAAIGGGGGGCTVTIQVNANATVADATRLAEMTKQQLDLHNHLNHVAST